MVELEVSVRLPVKMRSYVTCILCIRGQRLFLSGGVMVFFSA